MPIKVGLKEIEIWKNDSMENAVRKYEAEEAPKGQIVFYGPSNFTRWSEKWGMTPLRDALLGASGKPCVVNRGFGSSCEEHHVYYYHRMVRAIEPSVLVYSPGLGNGLAFGYTHEELWELAQRVLAYARADFPEMPIYLCGVNLKDHWDDPRYLEFNKWLREYAEQDPLCHYTDLEEFPELYRKEYYVADQVHFNQQGYNLYADYFRHVLRDELAHF